MIGPRKVPEFVTCECVPADFPAAALFVQRVQQLLAGGGSGESRALVKRAAKPPAVEEPFLGAIERHAQPVHQVDDPRRPVGHLLDGRLMLQEVAAVDGVVKVLPFAVAQLARLVVARC